MIKNRRTSGLLSMALATCLVVSAVPVQTVDSILGNAAGRVTAYAEETAQSTKPLTTLWKTQEVGTHEGTGTYAYDAAAKTVTVNGAGTKFDKSAGSDDLFYAYFEGKGDLTITAKMTVNNNGNAGYAGLLIRNTADEAGSASAALYADFANGSKNQIRYGYHKEAAGGGASQVNTAVTTASSDIYIKLEVSGEKATYHVASTADFSDEKVKTQTISGLSAKTIGFFATEGVTAEFSDVTVTSAYTTDDGADVKKQIFDSEAGEVNFSQSSSKDYSGNYDAGNSFETSANGNILSVNHTRSATVKGNIRDDKGMDYLLFPETSEDMTISADITVTKLDSGTDKQGLAIGQFNAKTGSAMKCDVLHIQKNIVIQHTFSTISGTGNCGSPKVGKKTDTANGYELGGTYTLTYTKSGNTAKMQVVSADGTVLMGSEANPGEFDLTQSYADLQTGQTVRYGLAFSGVTAEISNLTLKNAEGTVVYDQNDYYVAVGVAPVITNAATEVASDRKSMNITWDVAEEGSGNIKYAVYVSKDGGEYTKISDSKVNSFSYAGMDGDGKYQFKIVPYGGTTMGTAVETEITDYQAPLAQAELTAAGSKSKVELSWNAVEGASSYDVYRKLGSDGEAVLVKTTAEIAFTDTDVVEEEPYYYYVVAKNDKNTSNPSATMQVLTSDGHTGAYVYENEATKLTVAYKSNDTVFDDNALLVLTADEAGTAQLYVNDVLADTKTVGAGDEMKFEPELKKGRNDVTVIFTDAEGNATRKTFNFVANPDVDIVVDAAYTGEDGAESDGLPVYKTVQAAVNAVPEDNAEAKVIYIKNGEYNERVEVKSPYVSLLGQDSEKTHLFYSVCVANGNADSMWNRNAMYVDTAATGFTAENLTVENSYDYTNGSDQQADALCIVADQTACINVRLIGYQDTLLTDTRTKDENGNYAVTRQYFNKCYITGNVDFIYGAGTSVFEDCDIVARYTEYKSDGCYTAGRTYASTPYGYVFNNCRFLAEEGVADGAYRMARPWGADDSTTFMNCYLGRAISLETSYGDMSGNLAENARFAEYGSYGPGYTVNNKRPYLTSAQAAKFKTDTVMGDYDYSARTATLYGTQQEKPKTDITVVDKAEVVKNVAVDENAVIKNAAGETVNPGEVSVVIEKAGNSVIDSIMKGFTAGGILIADGSTVDYYDIELQDENGQAVMLESGKIQITFAYKEGIDYSKVNVIVYHLNEKTGVIEKLETQLTSEGIRFEADSFSPFAVYYENKTVQKDDVTKPDDTKKDDTKTDDVKKDDAGSGTQQGENTGAADAPEESENAQQSADTGVQTGDTANGFGFLAAAVAAAGAGAYEFLKKRKLIRR